LYVVAVVETGENDTGLSNSTSMASSGHSLHRSATTARNVTPNADMTALGLYAGFAAASAATMVTHAHRPHAPLSAIQPPWVVFKYFVETAMIARSSLPRATTSQASLWTQTGPSETVMRPTWMFLEERVGALTGGQGVVRFSLHQ
jgi:hypothetical protein